MKTLEEMKAEFEEAAKILKRVEEDMDKIFEVDERKNKVDAEAPSSIINANPSLPR